MKTTLKKVMLLASVFCAATSMQTTALAATMNAQQIMQKVYDREDGKTRQQTVHVSLISKNNKQRSRTIKSWSKDYSGVTKTAMKFIAPSSMKNTGMLIFDKDSQSLDDQWIYLPALSKVKKIAAGDQQSNFFGSDLIYADLTKRRVKDYQYKKNSNKTYKGKSLYYIEATPNASEKKMTGYKKIVFLIDPTTYLPVKTVFYLSNGNQKISEINTTMTVKNIVFPKKTTIVTLKNGSVYHKSIFEYKQLKVNEAISDKVFTQQSLKS